MPPEKLDELREALAEAGILGMTVREAKVFDRGTGRREVYRGSSYVVEFTSKVEVVMVVQDDVVPRILEVLETIPGMGDGHDPSVFISEVVEAVRNRTGEQNGPRPILHGRHGP
jgi:nitrogen regulatory protein P-II 1